MATSDILHDGREGQCRETENGFALGRGTPWVYMSSFGETEPSLEKQLLSRDEVQGTGKADGLAPGAACCHYECKASPWKLA